MNEPRRTFFRRVRHRIRLAWLVATAQQVAPAVALAAVGLLLAGWVTGWNGAVAWSLAVGLGSLAVLLIAAAGLKISDWEASRAAERGLGARDAFTTALEFNDPTDDVHQRIQKRADTLVASSRPAEAIPVKARKDRLRTAGLAAALALVIGLLPPLGSSPALSTDVAAALEAEAAEIERIAAAAASEDIENAEEIIAELERLAEELRLAESLEQALRSIEETSTRLGAMTDPDFLAQKAAVQGLARDLALRPLGDSSSLDAASQFQELAESLEGLSEQELRAVEDRLVDLAQSQAAGNPALSSQLAEAAASLASGDVAGAQDALNQAAASQSSGVSDARGQEALNQTRQALDSIRARLAGSGAEGGQAGGQGAGAGAAQQGQGGQSGQGGSGEGSPSGQISGVAPGDGDAEGQGGQGSIGAGDGADHGTGVELSTVFDPTDLGEISDLLRVQISGGSATGDITGTAQIETRDGDAVVPYATVLPEYLNAAADALSTLRLPPSMRAIVQSYFAQLAEAAQ